MPKKRSPFISFKRQSLIMEFNSIFPSKHNKIPHMLMGMHVIFWDILEIEMLMNEKIISVYKLFFFTWKTA